MKRHNKSFLWLVLLLICSTFAFTSCDRDDLNTDQYGNEISVLSYGPNPVLRGVSLLSREPILTRLQK